MLWWDELRKKLTEHRPPQDGDGERIAFSGFGTSVTLSGAYVVIIVGLLVALAALIFVVFRYMETSRDEETARNMQIMATMNAQSEASRQVLAEQMDLSRQQYWLIYRELRIQTALMALPEGKRSEVIDTGALRDNLREHLEDTPALNPPVLPGTVPPLRTPGQADPDQGDP